MIRVAFHRTNHHDNIKDKGDRPVWVLEDSDGKQHIVYHIDFGEYAAVKTAKGEPRKTLCSATYWFECHTPVMVHSDRKFGGAYMVA